MKSSVTVVMKLLFAVVIIGSFMSETQVYSEEAEEPISPYAYELKDEGSGMGMLTPSTASTASSEDENTTKVEQATTVQDKNSKNGLSRSEIVLLSGVSSTSFLLTLASAFILIMTVVFVVRRRKSDNMEINLITVHNYKLAGGSDHGSDTGSIHEQRTLLVEETKAEDMSGDIMNELLESHRIQMSDISWDCSLGHIQPAKPSLAVNEIIQTKRVPIKNNSPNFVAITVEADVNEDILDRPVLLTKPRSSVKDVVRLKPIMEVNETLPTTEADVHGNTSHHLVEVANPKPSVEVNEIVPTKPTIVENEPLSNLGVVPMAVEVDTATGDPFTDHAVEVAKPRSNVKEIVPVNPPVIEKRQSEETNVAPAVTGAEPRIVKFEPQVEVKEGEQVTLLVDYTGTPKPTVTWRMENRIMTGDYATELNANGQLVFFCVEPKHAGKYDFEIKNDFGSVHGTVTLIVQVDRSEREGGEIGGVATERLESNAIARERFGEYVKQLHQLNDKGFESHYKSLGSGEDGKDVSIGKSDDHRYLNRFKDITAYDEERISLEPIPNNPDYQHSYINASYIDGFSQTKMFIASQGPLPHTVTDFWRLVWQEKVKTIAMVTNLKEGVKEKCEKYWPERESDVHFGPFKISGLEENVYPYYTIRKLVLKHTTTVMELDISRDVTQYHFTSWPDHGVPEYAGPILNYLRRIKTESKSDTAPLLVHCSAGVGRTGTLIAIDIALAQASKERQVDIPKIIVDMRKQRMKMVQTVNQYTFLHDAVLEELICGDTQVPSSEFHEAVERLKHGKHQSGERDSFEKQFQVLGKVSLKSSEMMTSVAVVHPDKNRNSKFLPLDRWRVKLKMDTPNYIHASYANSYKQKKGFIIAQSPMKNTVRDFVKMIYERECGVVVMLCGCEEGGVEMCAQYWPSSTRSKVKCGDLSVKTSKVVENDGITQRTLTITNSKSDKGAHRVTQFQVKKWNSDGLCTNAQVFIDIYNQMNDIQSKASEDTPIVLHGRDTVSRVGVFCSLVNAIEMCKTEGVVDVFQVVKALRIQKPGAVLTVTQYRFIFEVVQMFLNSFSSYFDFNFSKLHLS